MRKISSKKTILTSMLALLMLMSVVICFTVDSNLKNTASANTNNLALAATASADDSVNADWSASKANDGNNQDNNGWHSIQNDGPNWLMLDFGSSGQTFNNVRLYARNDEVMFPVRFKLEVSDATDGEWNTVYDRTDMDFAQLNKGDYAEIYFSTVTARYLRLYITKKSESKYAAIAEFEVYNKPVNSTDNIARNCVLDYSTQVNNDPWAAKYAIDGIVNTDDYGWHSANNQAIEFLRFDFKKAVPFNRVDIYSRNNDSMFPPNINIEALLGNAWVSVAAQPSHNQIPANTLSRFTFEEVTSRYLRISITKTNANDYIALSEVKIFNIAITDDIENLALNSSLTYTSQVSDNEWAARNITDGIKIGVEDALGWHSENALQNEEIIIDLRSTKSFNEIVLVSREANNTMFPVRFKLEYSTNGSEWTMFSDNTASDFIQPEVDTSVSFFNQGNSLVNGRYVKINVTKKNAENYCALSEIEILNTSSLPSAECSILAGKNDLAGAVISEQVKTINKTVNSLMENISFLDSFVISALATYKVYSENTLLTPLSSAAIEVGENIFYVEVKAEDTTSVNVYTLTVIRPEINLAYGKSVSSSSTAGGQWAPSGLVDGEKLNDQGGFSSGSHSDIDHEEWAQVDLGVITTLNQINIYPRAGGICFPKKYSIEVSKDGEQYTTVYYQNNVDNKGTVITINLPNLEMRYIRINALTLKPEGLNYYFQLSEIEVYKRITLTEDELPYIFGLNNELKGGSLKGFEIEYNVDVSLNSKNLTNSIILASGATAEFYSDSEVKKPVQDITAIDTTSDVKLYILITNGLNTVVYELSLLKMTSSECDVLSVVGFDNAQIDDVNKTISLNIENSQISLSLVLNVSDGATYGLYFKEGCLNIDQIPENNLLLGLGENIFYVMVTAENGIINKKYTLMVNRAYATEALIVGVSEDSVLTFDEMSKTLSGSVASNVEKYIFDAILSYGSQYKYFSDSNCTQEISNTENGVQLAVGINTIYIKVIAQDGVANTVYTMTIGRAEAKYNVTFESNGGSAIQSITGVISGSVIAEPTAPRKDGYTFAGWYKDSGLTEKFDFSSETVTDNMTLYAKWTETSTGCRGCGTISQNNNNGGIMFLGLFLVVITFAIIRMKKNFNKN